VRRPAVSGVFYAADAARLREQVARCFVHPHGPGRPPAPWGRHRLRALIVPHAALEYSGPVAAHAYERLAAGPEPDVIVIVGPDHYCAGAAIALSPFRAWATPIGEVPSDHPTVRELRRLGLQVDARGHAREHCVEVQLPFLQALGYRGAVVPIVMADQEAEAVQRLASLLAQALHSLEAVVIASTDFSHYLPHEAALAADRLVLDALREGDGARMLEVVRRHEITMCGAGPAAAALEAGRRLGGGVVRVLHHATSGDISGDRRTVVGYAAAVLDAG
jgi:hypothetical protein